MEAEGDQYVQHVEVRCHGNGLSRDSQRLQMNDQQTTTAPTRPQLDRGILEGWAEEEIQIWTGWIWMSDVSKT